MSMHVTPLSLFSFFAPSENQIRRTVWGNLFGGVIASRRETRGLSLEDAARLSGMTLSEWMAIEDGCVPEDPERLQAVADTLEMDRDRVFRMAAFCFPKDDA